mmetsp:Transcript_24712/g.53916  ORF Transcript_24712/g.53916 Transcript_24712/m.53916 type:complete len:344 (+) Transcript_24712:1114-2145(+)
MRSGWGPSDAALPASPQTCSATVGGPAAQRPMQLASTFCLMRGRMWGRSVRTTWAADRASAMPTRPVPEPRSSTLMPAHVPQGGCRSSKSDNTKPHCHTTSPTFPSLLSGAGPCRGHATGLPVPPGTLLLSLSSSSSSPGQRMAAAALLWDLAADPKGPADVPGGAGPADPVQAGVAKELTSAAESGMEGGAGSVLSPMQRRPALGCCRILITRPQIWKRRPSRSWLAAGPEIRKGTIAISPGLQGVPRFYFWLCRASDLYSVAGESITALTESLAFLTIALAVLITRLIELPYTMPSSKSTTRCNFLLMLRSNQIKASAAKELPRASAVKSFAETWPGHHPK